MDAEGTVFRRVCSQPGRYPSPRSGWGTPPRTGVPPMTEQQNVHLLRGGRYASYVQAGELSCFSVYISSQISCETNLYDFAVAGADVFNMLTTTHCVTV